MNLKNLTHDQIASTMPGALPDNERAMSRLAENLRRSQATHPPTDVDVEKYIECTCSRLDDKGDAYAAAERPAPFETL